MVEKSLTECYNKSSCVFIIQQQKMTPEALVYNLSELEEQFPESGPIAPIRHELRQKWGAEIGKSALFELVVVATELTDNSCNLGYGKDGFLLIEPTDEAIMIVAQNSGLEQNPKTKEKAKLRTKDEVVSMIESGVDPKSAEAAEMLDTHGRGLHLTEEICGIDNVEIIPDGDQIMVVATLPIPELKID